MVWIWEWVGIRKKEKEVGYKADGDKCCKCDGTFVYTSETDKRYIISMYSPSHPSIINPFNECVRVGPPKRPPAR